MISSELSTLYANHVIQHLVIRLGYIELKSDLFKNRKPMKMCTEKEKEKNKS